MFLLVVFAFLSSIRFRKDVPLNYTLSTRYGKTLVTVYRHLQRTRLRRDKAALDIEFLQKFLTSTEDGIYCIPKRLDIKEDGFISGLRILIKYSLP